MVLSLFGKISIFINEKMKRKILILSVLSLIFTWNIKAQDDVKFTASAPSVVYLDTPFQLIYSINTSAKELQAPDFQFFEILAGPFESRSSYTQIINGERTSSVNLSYTFTLMPNKTGNFKIPGASILVNGEKVRSNDLTIKVEEADNSAQNSTQPSNRTSGGSTQKVTSKSIFIRPIVSKTNAYEQEAITITYKLYTLLDVAQFTNFKLPDFNGFLKQDIEQNQNRQLAAETYKGRSYGTVVLYQAILFPQHTGELEIGKADFTAMLRLQNKAQVRSIFDDFFDSYTNVEKTLTAPAVRIKVNALPIEGKPSSFSGAVGNFNLTSSLSSGNLKTDEAATIKVVISGVGNMKLLKNPEIKFPDGIEVYDPKVDNQFNTASGGVSGTKTIEYLFIPRRSGRYDIPSAELSYYDLNNKTYRTLRTPAYKLNVVKGEGGETVVENFTGKEDVKQISKDIRHIYTGDIKIKQENRPFFGTLPFWMTFLIPLILAAILFVYFRKQMKENSNIALVKTKKANKVALKRLKLAQKFLEEGKKENFYAEIMKSVWTYLSDKLSIPVAELNKDNIQSKMMLQGIDDELIGKFTHILDTCEFASYAPNSGQLEMGNLYQDTIDAISNVEEFYKKK